MRKCLGGDGFCLLIAFLVVAVREALYIEIKVFEIRNLLSNSASVTPGDIGGGIDLFSNVFSTDDAGNITT